MHLRIFAILCFVKARKFCAQWYLFYRFIFEYFKKINKEIPFWKLKKCRMFFCLFVSSTKNTLFHSLFGVLFSWIFVYTASRTALNVWMNEWNQRKYERKKKYHPLNVLFSLLHSFRRFALLSNDEDKKKWFHQQIAFNACLSLERLVSPRNIFCLCRVRIKFDRMQSSVRILAGKCYHVLFFICYTKQRSTPYLRSQCHGIYVRTYARTLKTTQPNFYIACDWEFV